MSVVTAPPWLAEEAEIVALLGAALDRFDRQRGVDRERQFSLMAENYLPSLLRADAAADQTWGLVKDLRDRGVLSIRTVRRSPYDPEWKGAKVGFSPTIEETLRAWLNRDWNAPAMQLWRLAVERNADSFPDGGAVLLNQRLSVANRTAEEVVAAMISARDVRGPVTLRQLSATLFWGDSKVLDERGELVAALWPELEIRERALVVAVYLPATCRGVLFIENQDTYTAAAGGTVPGVTELALVYAAGFRGAASRVRSRAGALLHYAGVGEGALVSEFDEWWFGLASKAWPCWFWGDLDFSGMQILKSLRSRFADLCAWQPGYEPMLARLKTSAAYSGRLIDDRGQIDPMVTGCPYADSTLLQAIRELGPMDQEVLSR
jgi:Uncharacterized protein conserved in bacteria C-term(DUF2220)